MFIRKIVRSSIEDKPTFFIFVNKYTKEYNNEEGKNSADNNAKNA